MLVVHIIDANKLASYAFDGLLIFSSIEIVVKDYYLVTLQDI